MTRAGRLTALVVLAAANATLAGDGSSGTGT
jgi:hypothetical protein